MSESHQKKSLYVPQLESDACGIGMIANLEKKYSHELVSNALTMLENMEHRGACGCDPESGDGAGLLMHVPHELFASEDLGFSLPEQNSYAVGCFFIPKDTPYNGIYELVKKCSKEIDIDFLGSRRLPVNSTILGETSSGNEPDIYHFFFLPQQKIDTKSFERKLLILRKYLTHQVIKAYPQSKDDFYITSLSSKTLIYKGAEEITLTSNGALG